MRWNAMAVAVALIVLGATSPSARSQALYRCSSDGRVYLSDRPCGGRPSTVLGATGPLRERPTTYPQQRAAGKAVDYLEYLTPLCAELNEGLRVGPSRGLGSRAMQELRTNYREQCGEDEADARRKLAEAQRQKRDARVSEAKAVDAQRERDTISREQCDEMYRIVHRRRQTLAAMTPGERADFDRFESNWKARCHPG